jgi:hypothetical protein
MTTIETLPPVRTGPFTPTAADMEAVHYGIPVCHVGEDGDLLALGHHDARKVLAAFNRHARVCAGLLNLADDRSTTVADLLPSLRQRWALFRPPDAASEWDDPDCPWYCDWVDEPNEAGSVPVTILRY